MPLAERSHPSVGSSVFPMSLDVSDPRISMAYDALTQKESLRWFLMSYGSKRNHLNFCASGTGELEELYAHIIPGNVHYGVFREQTSDAPVCISLAVIPDSVKGVHRARALVHARAISTKFKTHQSLHVSTSEQITREALTLRNNLRAAPHDAMTINPMDSGPSSLPPIDSTSSQPVRDHHDSALSTSPMLLPSTYDTTPLRIKSQRKLPRLFMSSVTRSSTLEHVHTPATSRNAEKLPSMPSATSPRSPHSPAVSSSEASSPIMLQSSHDDAVTNSAPTALMHGEYSSNLRSKSSWQVKKESPLPPTPPHSDTEPELSNIQRSRSAFESDGETGSDNSIPMHGPLAEIGLSRLAASPASPIGSIPDALSIASHHSSLRGPSPAPLREPSPVPLQVEDLQPVADIIKDNSAIPGSAPAQQTPAQEEASRARLGWEAKEHAGNPDADGTVPQPATLDSTPSPLHNTTEKEDLEPARAPHESEDPRHDPESADFANDTESSLVRRSAIADSVLPATGLTNDTQTGSPTHQNTHRRVVSQDQYKPSLPPKTRTRFVDHTSPETQEEERRLAILEEERQRRIAERARREREERAEAEERDRLFAERKERERERRVELARQTAIRLEEDQRRVMEARAEQEAREAREKEARLAREKEAAARVRRRAERSGSGMTLLSGFVTLEMASVWRRRYFWLSTDSWRFFRSDKDVATPLMVVDLVRVRGLREWNEGYDELESIPHSFAVEITDEEPWRCFADSAEDKEILLGLLNQAAGL